ncbi:MAG: hypothetical protein HY814_04705 [Candidatus Riflebacteria bacterium]|nr:hypothetical protein [Candidatus Riflebacteria bacterium]
MSDWVDTRSRPPAPTQPSPGGGGQGWGAFGTAGVVAAVSPDLAPPVARPWHVAQATGSRDLVIVNRFALRSRGGRAIGPLRDIFPSALFAEPDLATRLLATTDDQALPFDRVVVSGGDGTLNRFLPQVLNADLPVLLAPAGTANDLAHEMGVGRWSPYDGDELGRLNEKRLDVIDASGHPFSTVGYLGFGSDVVTAVNRWRQYSWTRPAQVALGKFIYVMGVLWMGALRRLPLYRLCIRESERETVLTTPLVVVANQPRVGGTMTLAHGTRNDDGRFRILAFRQTSGFALLRAISSLCRGTDPSLAGVESFETSRAQLESLDGRPFLFCADGEELLQGTRLELGLHARQLRLLVPA